MYNQHYAKINKEFLTTLVEGNLIPQSTFDDVWAQLLRQDNRHSAYQYLLDKRLVEELHLLEFAAEHGHGAPLSTKFLNLDPKFSQNFPPDLMRVTLTFPLFREGQLNGLLSSYCMCPFVRELWTEHLQNQPIQWFMPTFVDISSLLPKATT